MLAELQIWNPIQIPTVIDGSAAIVKLVLQVLLSAIIGGLSGATVQSLILMLIPQYRSRRLVYWVAFAPAAIIVGAFIGGTALTMMDAWLQGWRTPLIGLLVWGAFGSGVVGLGEWAILFSRTQWIAYWLVVCLLAGAIAIIAALSVGGLTFWRESWALSCATGGAIWGLITGLGLARLLPQTVSSSTG